MSDDLKITPLVSDLTMRELDDLKISFNDVTVEQITIGRAEVYISLSFCFFLVMLVTTTCLTYSLCLYENRLSIYLKLPLRYDILCINQWALRFACKEAGRINCKTLLGEELLASLDLVSNHCHLLMCFI